MSTTSIGPTYDPTSTAAALAQKYISASQDILTANTKGATVIGTGLGNLSSAILSFQTSLQSLTGLNKAMFAQAATFSDATIGSATASASAAAGTYAFFVQQLATADQVSYSGLQDDTQGMLKVMVGSTAINVDLTGGAHTAREVAAAINADSENAGLVTASVITTDTGSELVLTAKNTGKASQITLDTSGLDAVSTGQSLAVANIAPPPDPAADPAAPPPRAGHVLVQAQDAIIHVGTASGTAITQATNTFSNIDGVKMTFTRAQAAGAAPVTLTVGADTSATTSNVQALIDAYNKLKGALDAMVDPGDPTKGQAGGVFAHDGGIRALRDRLITLMRPAGSTSLASFGILAAKNGSLALDSARLARQLAVDPHGLDTLVGSSSASAPSGIASALDTFLKGWSSVTNGQIQKRKDENAQVQKDLTARQVTLDSRYNAAYSRYLLQFTQLQTLQGQMSNNVSMFDALFGNNQSK
ncbi:MAG: flagellar filament capping protein FliD [Massilia sp.]